MKRPICIIAVFLAFALAAAPSAFADNTQTFTISMTGGALAGNTYTGSFSWDPTGGNVIINAFSTDFPGWVDATTNYGATINDFYWKFTDGNGGLVLWYTPSALGQYAGNPIGNPADAMYFFSPGYFESGTTEDTLSFTVWDSGTVAYGTQNPDAPAVPEPGTFLLLASGLSGMLGAIRRKIKA